MSNPFDPLIKLLFMKTTFSCTSWTSVVQSDVSSPRANYLVLQQVFSQTLNSSQLPESSGSHL